MRRLGQSGIEVGAIGLGGWAIGGPFTYEGRAAGWGEVDGRETGRAIAAAIERGVTLFDTADIYGTGQSEMALGQALAGRRHEMVIATKFGNTFDAGARAAGGQDVSPAYIRQALAASLARLGTDYVDLYQIHIGDLDPDRIAAVAETLEALAQEGVIRAWGWSTDDDARVAALPDHPHFAAVQQEMSLLAGNAALLRLVEARGLASLNRSPLAMGLLGGRYGRTSRLPADDVRAAGHAWMHAFRDGVPDMAALSRLEALRDCLTVGGRTLAQGALCWLLARSPATIPIPGFKSVAQAVENAGAIAAGPLPAATMAEIDSVLQQPA